jgi:hypothetical protein
MQLGQFKETDMVRASWNVFLLGASAYPPTPEQGAYPCWDRNDGNNHGNTFALPGE